MTAPSTPTREWLALLGWVAAGFGAFVAAIVFIPESRDILLTAVMNVFGFFSTPFILETSVALIGLCVVLTLNRWRLLKEGDGWVYMAVQDASGAVPSLPTQLSAIEGYLEMGMLQEAEESLQRIESQSASGETAVQNLRARLNRLKA